MVENLNNIPAKVTATATFYNTTGIIEKGKNIYFSPFLTNLTNYNTRVYMRWLSLFRTKAYHNSEFDGFALSGWQPEDRTLRVVADISQFRALGGYVGKVNTVFNYIIILERYYKMEGESEVLAGLKYYGYFIDSAKQAGRGSVELSVSPDHFTNVFFLQNETEIPKRTSAPIDVFNPVLKETYVNRQHYDRVKLFTPDPDDYWLLYHVGTYSSAGNIVINLSQQYPTYFTDAVESVEITSHEYPDVIDLTDDENYQPLEYNLSQDQNGDWILTILPPQSCLGHNLDIDIPLTFTYKTELQETNLPIVSQIEEGFKYKRLYKDYKEPLFTNDLFFTESELEQIKNGASWSSLSDTTKTKMVKYSMGFIHITITDRFILPLITIRDSNNVNQQTGRIFPPTLTNTDTNNFLVTLVQPVFLETELLKTYRNYIKPSFMIDTRNEFYQAYGVKMHVNLTGLNQLNQPTYNFPISDSANQLADLRDLFLSDISPYSAYVVSAVLTRESSLSKYINYSISTYNGVDYVNLEFNVCGRGAWNPNSYYSGQYTPILPENKIQYSALPAGIGGNYNYRTNLAGFIQKTVSGDGKVIVKPDDSNYRLDTDGYGDDARTCGFVLIEKFENIGIKNLDLTPNAHSSFNAIGNLSSDYYDPVLSFNPYSFYSISYLGRIETPLNYLNFYDNPFIDVDIYVYTTEINKYCVMPIYTVDGLKQKYYTESIEQSMTNQLTIPSEKIFDYLIANRTQMKNQYAVNDLNLQYGLVQAGIGTVAQVARGAISGGAYGGWQGALVGSATGAIAGGMNLISQGIDFEKSEKEISMNQKAKLADMGSLPSNLKQVGTDINVDLAHNELGLYLNHYRIDQVSYESICKYLERYGYVVNLFQSLNVNNRVGWNYVKLLSLDFNTYISQQQEDSIREIFFDGVTLLHDPDMLHNEAHNYEYSIKGLYTE